MSLCRLGTVARFITGTALAATTAGAQVLLEVDISKRADSIRHVIDFFEYHPESDWNDGANELHPRFHVNYGSGLGRVEMATGQGVTTVGNLMGAADSAEAYARVSAGKARGVKIWQVWSEPNRTFGPRYNNSDNWLRTVTWESFCIQAEKLYRGAKAADPSCMISGPVITGDHKNDPQWFQRIVRFVNHWIQNGLTLDIVSFNPPWNPGQVHEVAKLAQGLSRVEKLGVKAVGLGEYPFFLDGCAVHVRFFHAFETAWNVKYAAKSYFRANPTNSGLLTAAGVKTPSYWLYYQYARMAGRRVATTSADNGLVMALASYDDRSRTAVVLAANDKPSATPLDLQLRSVRGRMRFKVSSFTGTGLKQLQSAEITAQNDNTATIRLGEVPAGDAFHVEVQFDEAQAAVGTLRPYHGSRLLPMGNRPMLLLTGPGIRGCGTTATEAGVLNLTGRRLLPGAVRIGVVEP